jgi:hypothetical protein
VICFVYQGRQLKQRYLITNQAICGQQLKATALTFVAALSQHLLLTEESGG